MNNSNVLNSEFIESFTKINLNDLKRKMLPVLEDVLFVNSLLNDDIISDFRWSGVFYDDLNEMQFEEFLDNWFMSELDVEQNNREIMLYLQYVYNS